VIGKEEPTVIEVSGNFPHVSLDESNCRVIRLIVGAVTNVSFSGDGNFIICGGEDGSIHLLTTIRRFGDLSTDIEQPVSAGQDLHHNGHFYMVERQKMSNLRSKLLDLEFGIEQSKKDNELHIGKLLEAKDRLFKEIEGKLKKELQNREETIVTTRKEYLNMRRSMQEEIEQLRKYNEESLGAMELAYEKKLAQESLYLEKMKQAYDEYVVHSRMDMVNLHQQTETKIRSIEMEKKRLVDDIEKQKSAILQYYDYVKLRNSEVLDSLEERQANERVQLKQQLEVTSTKLADSQAQNMKSEVQASRTIQRLRVDIEQKELEIMRVNSDIDWANDRIQKLEGALQQATTELKARSELVERFEGKVGELQQKIDDLERSVPRSRFIDYDHQSL
jgi:chromosome segregation ATPase